MTKDLAISVSGLGKRYRRGIQTDITSIRDVLQQGVGSLFRARENEKGTFWALKDASFDVARGENVGIIGLNGAGKSTLLKLLSRITVPTEGIAHVNGRLGALLEVGTGFHRELTGRENVFLYGSILGMTQEEIEGKFDQIVAFSEIADFIDTPVKQYSSGMYVRLAFAVAAHLDPDILVLDEVLAVGDFTFQRKCIEFTKALEKKGATILFVSHNMFSIKSMCERVIYLKGGRIVFDGPVDEGLKLYESEARLATASWFRPDPGLPRVKIADMQLLDENGGERHVYEFGERMRIRVEYDAEDALEDANILISILRDDGVHCSSFCSAIEGLRLPEIRGSGAVELTTPPLKLVADKYSIQVVVRQRGFERMINAQNGPSFHVKHNLYTETAFGTFYEPGSWTEVNADADNVKQLKAYRA